MLADLDLATSGLAESGISASGIGSSDPFAASVVLNYPFRGDLIDAEGAADATVVRSTTGLFRPTSHTQSSAGTNVARFEGLGALVENAATNNILFSDDQSNGAWLNFFTDTTVGQEDPAGGTDASLITINDAGGPADLVQVIASANVNSVGFWAKAGTISQVSVAALDGVTPALNEDFTLTNKWVYYTFETSIPADTFAFFAHSGGLAGSGAVGDSFFIYNIQGQDGDQCTSPIITAGTAVTRTGDTLVGDETNIPAPTVDQTWRATLTIVEDISNQVMLLTGETTAREIRITGAGAVTGRWGGAVITTATGFCTVGDTYNLVLTKRAASFEFYINNVLIGTDTPGAVGGTPTAIHFASGGSSLIRDAKIYDRYFTASEVKDA